MTQLRPEVSLIVKDFPWPSEELLEKLMAVCTLPENEVIFYLPYGYRFGFLKAIFPSVDQSFFNIKQPKAIKTQDLILQKKYDDEGLKRIEPKFFLRLLLRHNLMFILAELRVVEEETEKIRNVYDFFQTIDGLREVLQKPLPESVTNCADEFLQITEQFGSDRYNPMRHDAKLAHEGRLKNLQEAKHRQPDYLRHGIMREICLTYECFFGKKPTLTTHTTDNVVSGPFYDFGTSIFNGLLAPKDVPTNSGFRKSFQRQNKVHNSQKNEAVLTLGPSK